MVFIDQNPIVQGFIHALTNGNPENLLIVVLGLTALFYLIYSLGGRVWAFIYVALIPFLNWSFGIIPEFSVMQPNQTFAKGLSLHPMTMVTGLVFVVRDFVQREMKQKVLVCMGFAIGWSFFYAWPVIALASGIAFAVSEFFDWLLFTFTKYRLSTRILLSSAVAAPIDTSIFLYGADLARQIQLGDPPGNTLHLANWIVFIIGKMVGAVIVSSVIRQREDAGKISPHEA
ncbi:MAG: VUT family protein [Henriciella sp.]|nr:VUT family protein [Henriciella sp.]